MANHRKNPLFLRIKTSDAAVVCINPQQLASFQILEKAKLQQKDGTVHEAPAVKLFFPNGTGLSYVVGIDITQEEFNYISFTLAEFLYLNEPEFAARQEANEKARLEEWNKVMADEEEELKKLTEAAPKTE